MDREIHVWIIITFQVKSESIEIELDEAEIKRKINEVIKCKIANVYQVNKGRYIIRVLNRYYGDLAVRKDLRGMISRLKKEIYIEKESISFDLMESYDIYPPRLFLYRKWCNHTKDIILKNELFMSHPKFFNDPFDCSVAFCNGDKGVADLIENIGIRCFGAQNDNILMWSHYANNHEGVCLEFDADRLLDLSQGELIRVRYRKNYPIYVNEESVDIKAAVSYKYLDWKYEQEFRLLHGNSKNKQFIFPPDALKNIYIGCRMADRDKEELIRIIIQREKMLKNVDDIGLYVMRIDDSAYKLNLEKFECYTNDGGDNSDINNEEKQTIL